MNETQLLLFKDAPEAVDSAIHTLTAYTPTLPNHLTFAQQLGTQLLTLPPGSVILAAVPMAAATGDLCVLLQQYLDEAQSRGVGPGSGGLAILSVPTAPSPKRLEESLLDRYRDAPALSSVRRVSPAMTDLVLHSDIIQRDRFQVTSSLVAHRVSTHYYLLHNAHFLQRSRGGVVESADHVRWIIRMAEESRRTQVLLGNASVVCKWLATPEIADATVSCPLMPYDISDKGDRGSFESLLATYQQAIPWAETPRLVEKLDVINWAVSGCPVRLQKWMLRALMSAKAQGRAALDWEFVSEHSPLPAEQRAAADDFIRLRALKSVLPATAPAESRTEKKSKRKPFSPPLTRPRAGFAA